MERLTEHHFIETKGSYMRCSDNCEMENCGECEKLDDLIDRLAAYEDTGLTPEEVAELKTPCDLCVYNPPSSRDGKACSMCPAMGKGGAE